MKAHQSESKYIEQKDYLSRYAEQQSLLQRREPRAAAAKRADDAALREAGRRELPRFLSYLTDKCGLEFRGRVLEIGAGTAWLSAEISKLPLVVEIYTTDSRPKVLLEQAPKVFRDMGALAGKITRMPADYHRLKFRDNYFDAVVCSAVLHEAANIVQVLREAKRVLKPGGRLVAIREPVWPLVSLKSRARMLARLEAKGKSQRFYTLSDYKEFFRQAGLPLEVKRVNTSSGFKYYVNAVVNGLTHARYAFIGTKRGKG